MSYRSLAPVAAVAALLSMNITNAVAQFAYVPPSGIYVGAPGYDYGYGAECGGYAIVAYEAPGHRCGCDPGRPYVAPRYGYGRGPVPVPYGPVPRGYGYGPPPPPPYGYGPVPRGNAYGPPPAPGYGAYGYGPEDDYGYGPPPAAPYSYRAIPRGSYGAYGYAPERDYGPPPRQRRPARTVSRPPNANAAELTGGSRAPAPFAGQR